MRSTMSESPEGIRLQKVLSKAGVASRRAAEDLIAEGRVSVDGEVVREFGRRVDPKNAVIHVDGVRVVLSEDMVYLAFNKPLGVHSTMTDDRGRPCVGDYIHKYERNANAGIFHVGRLDADSEGLILLTNDGDLGHRLTHPSFEVPKTYMAEVPGPVSREVGRRLREGVELEDGLARADSFKLIDSMPGKAMVEIVLHEGRNRIVRRMLEEVGHPVERLVRTAFADVRLGNQRPGTMRALNRSEVGALFSAAQL
jgi:23S rRNA pseudouridine2605 synthase